MAPKRVVREASHAGSWYSSDPARLSVQLEEWLDAVRTPVQCIGPLSRGEDIAQLPVPGARAIIAPHAGYAYSGPAAAYAYKCWDMSKAKRVFLLGPSHHHYLSSAALSRCAEYATPLGNLKIDTATVAQLHETGQFDWMSKSVDEDEHSLEMHLPYIYKMLERQHGGASNEFPLLVPIMVGNTSASMETKLGTILTPYLADSSNAFVISSDFAHWGTRFRYTYYKSHDGTARQLSGSQRSKLDPPIHESIKGVDFECMGECEGGDHGKWLAKLEETGNTVCGRHPIGVMISAVQGLKDSEHGRFTFVKYDRSGLVSSMSESSVSYASAFAVL